MQCRYELPMSTVDHNRTFLTSHFAPQNVLFFPIVLKNEQSAENASDVISSSNGYHFTCHSRMQF